MTLPRGIRNNNPGNIRKSQTSWQGEVHPGTDPDFCQFSSMTYGCRAIAMILLDYQAEHGLNTIAGMIGRWAPPSENNTNAYVNDIATRANIPASTKIDLFGNLGDLEAIVAAICFHENGIPVSTNDTAAGSALAFDEYK
jgi:hypothetical protein